MAAYGEPPSVLGRARRELERLQTEIEDVLSEIIKPMVKQHDELRGLQSDRSHRLNTVHVHSGSPKPGELPGH